MIQRDPEISRDIQRDQRDSRGIQKDPEGSRDIQRDPGGFKKDPEGSRGIQSQKLLLTQQPHLASRDGKSQIQRNHRIFPPSPHPKGLKISVFPGITEFFLPALTPRDGKSEFPPESQTWGCLEPERCAELWKCQPCLGAGDNSPDKNREFHRRNEAGIQWPGPVISTKRICEKLQRAKGSINPIKSPLNALVLPGYDLDRSWKLPWSN